MAERSEQGPTLLFPLRAVALGVGFLCAVVASLMLLMTDNAQSLRVGILVALWGFVLAALAAARRQTEKAVGVGAEIELRKSYELELEREVAARREYELRLEAMLRRELQEEFAAQVGDLRVELTRLRSELSEQWDSELRVERMVMRTQSVRMGSERRESLEQSHAQPSYEQPSYAQPSYEQPSHAQPSHEQPPYEQPSQEQPSRDGLSTKEFPALIDGGPPVPGMPMSTAPVPSLGEPRPSGYPAFIEQPAPTPSPVVAPGPERGNEGSDDVLSRVLAEAGAKPGGRRRKHRYADEDEDAVSAGF